MSNGVVIDKTMDLPDPGIVHYPYVGHGNAIVGILKQLAPAATVYTSTIESQPSDAPGGTTDRRLAAAIERLLCEQRIHILVVPFGGSTRHGTMPITERVLDNSLRWVDLGTSPRTEAILDHLRFAAERIARPSTSPSSRAAALQSVAQLVTEI